ncbi:hypothetical protein [Aestuariivita sp.]|jgi:hypothetical protein|uniref:hypothetical protein n=1 Tax=Aestuariivita sp. TaxID=1872407 RepID=UPI0021724343|nr:hypothetical protein [Aestuariivita sp.]MCE8009811.1 hypothetical protein [Aestuariivita sp.]
MQIIFHTGAHFTDEDRLMKCLLRNKDAFAQRGISVPGPGRYRQLLRSTLNAMRRTSPDPDAREVLLDAILDDETAERVILSNAHFFGVANAAVRDGVLYPAAPERLANLQRLFAGDEIEMFIALRNPATFLPQVHEKSPERTMDEILGGRDPRELRWSTMIQSVRQAAPDVPVTVWCSEDTPLTWAQIIRDLAGLEPEQKITGAFDLLKTIMTQEGMQRFRAYLSAQPELTEMQKRRVIAAFLDKFALEDELEDELDIPGWTEALVEEMTDIYDEDVLTIERMAGVQFIAP